MFFLPLERLSLLSLTLLGKRFSSAWRSLFLHLLSFSPFHNVPILPTWTFSDLTISCFGRMLFSFFFWQRSVQRLAHCSLCSAETTLSFSAGPVCLSFSPKVFAVLQANRWSREYQQIYRFFSQDFCSVATVTTLHFCPSISHFLAYLAATIFSCLIHNQVRWVPGQSFHLSNNVADECQTRCPAQAI